MISIIIITIDQYISWANRLKANHFTESDHFERHLDISNFLQAEFTCKRCGICVRASPDVTHVIIVYIYIYIYTYLYVYIFIYIYIHIYIYIYIYDMIYIYNMIFIYMYMLAIFGYRILDVDKRWMIFRSASLPGRAEPEPASFRLGTP